MARRVISPGTVVKTDVVIVEATEEVVTDHATAAVIEVAIDHATRVVISHATGVDAAIRVVTLVRVRPDRVHAAVRPGLDQEGRDKDILTTLPVDCVLRLYVMI